MANGDGKYTQQNPWGTDNKFMHDNRIEKAQEERINAKEAQQVGAFTRATPKFVSNTASEESVKAEQQYLSGIGSLKDKKEQPSIDETLKERGSKYGPFEGHAKITQQLKQVIHNSPAFLYARINLSQIEALDMIAHKIGRICNGDPNYKDSWTDIAGYAKLVADTLKD